MQINGEGGGGGVEKKYWAFSQYTKICGGREHCFMCDFITHRSMRIPVFFTSFVLETSQLIKLLQMLVRPVYLQKVVKVLPDDIFIPTVTQLVDLLTTIILYLQSVIHIVHTECEHIYPCHWHKLVFNTLGHTRKVPLYKEEPTESKKDQISPSISMTYAFFKHLLINL